MNVLVRRRLLPLFTLLVAYAGWDIVDQRVLQTRSPILGGYVVDWAVAGLAGYATIAFVSHRKRKNLERAAKLASPSINPLILDHVAQSSRVLHEYLADIQDAVGDSITLEGTQQIRLLRQAMVATHHAQSVLDEISSLVDGPRSSPPPQEQLMMHQPH